VIVGRYSKPGSAQIEVHATAAGKRVTIPVDVTLPTSSDLEPVASLWARKRIDETTDETVITNLGLNFHLVTEYTSFVAVDRTRVVDGAGHARTVEQPAVSPEGVNIDSAVGGGEDPYAYSPSSYSGSSSSGGGGGGYSGDGGGFGGGDADPLTLLLALALIPLAWTLRRNRAC
jgi:Ca-activated chloride channel family protein